MRFIVEVKDGGLLALPPEAKQHVSAHARYVLEIQGEVLILRPEERPPFWATATPEQRKHGFLQWVARHKEGPGLPDEALRREALYD